MPRKELESVLDYILNKADDAEFEVILKACERKGRDRAAFARLGGEAPGDTARRVAADLQQGVGATMENLRGTVRSMVETIIRQKAPELGDADIAAALDAYAPLPEHAQRRSAAQSPLPPEAMLSMIKSFVEYSEGRMAPSRQKELWSENRSWSDAYWRAFPPEIKALIKAYLDGKIDGDTMGTATLSVLGL